MKLSDFDISPAKRSKKLLKENFGTSFDANKLSLKSTETMLQKVSNLISEAKSKPSYHSSHKSPQFLKLVVMEQALWTRYAELGGTKRAKIVVTEAENVAQAQTVLAAKDLVDSLQKMIQSSSDLLVKSLPVVVDSIRSQIGANEGREFNDDATEILRGVVDALMDAKSKMQSTTDSLTGEGGAEAFDGESPENQPASTEPEVEETSDEPEEVDAEVEPSENDSEELDSAESPETEESVETSNVEAAAGRELR